MAQSPSQKEPKPVTVEEAIRFQRAEDAAAARQAGIDAGRAGELNSADRMATPRTKTNRTTSAAARKTSPSQH